MSFARFTKIAAPTSPPASTGELYYDSAAPGVATPAKLVAIDESGNKVVVGGFAIKDYRLIKVTHLLQGTTTYTPSNGVQALYVECVGGGGAGGGGAAASSNLSLGSGGGAGGYAAAWITGTLLSSYACVVGAGGTGASGTTGNVGADTTFNVSTVVAKGGSGGTTLAAGTSNVPQGGVAGGAAASGTGDDKLDGSDGGWGLRISASVGQSGDGGTSPLGGALARGVTSATSVGTAGKLYGGGGAGSMTTGTANAGGAGANGLIRVWEFA